MTNFAHGRAAEDAAAKYLQNHGYKIISQNWRTRYCEIDIVAQKKNKVLFVEVKYRLNAGQGGGFDYITPAKLKQMSFAAEMWVHDNHWKHDYALAAVEVAGQDYAVTNFLADIDI